jgi:hypothetical protein
MFNYPEDNVSATTNNSLSQNPRSQSPDKTNAKTGQLLATPMNLEPVSIDQSPGSTFADYLTVADSDENFGEPDIKERKATPAAKTKNAMPTKTTPAEVPTRKETPAPLLAGIIKCSFYYFVIWYT